MKTLVAALSLSVLAVACKTTESATAVKEAEAEGPVVEPGPVMEHTGQLVRTAGIGGENTGWSLKTDRGLQEVDFMKKGLLGAANDMEDQMVKVTGFLTLVHGVEIPTRSVLVATALEALKTPAAPEKAALVCKDFAEQTGIKVTLFAKNDEPSRARVDQIGADGVKVLGDLDAVEKLDTPHVPDYPAARVHYRKAGLVDAGYTVTHTDGDLTGSTWAIVEKITIKGATQVAKLRCEMAPE